MEQTNRNEGKVREDLEWANGHVVTPVDGDRVHGVGEARVVESALEDPLCHDHHPVLYQVIASHRKTGRQHVGDGHADHVKRVDATEAAKRVKDPAHL